MQASPSPTTRRSRHRPAGPVTGLTLAVLLLAGGTVGCSKMASDATVLKNGLTGARPDDWDHEFALGVGPLTLSLARAVTAFFELDPEPRALLHAVRAAEVGVYRHKREGRDLDLPAMCRAADETMIDRGWERLLTVVNQGELVAVYVPSHLDSPRDLRVCLAVLDGPQLVVVAARSDLEPLLKLASQRAMTPEHFVSTVRP